MGGRTLAETARKIGASRRDLTRFLCRARGSKGKTEELTLPGMGGSQEECLILKEEEVIPEKAALFHKTARQLAVSWRKSQKIVF